MMDHDRTSWVLDGPVAGPFAHPRGMPGRLAATVMARSNARPAREVAARLALQPQQTVLEVGFGPGVLLRALADRSEAPRLVGVEPSEVMIGRARRRVPHADLRPGTAAGTGLADECVDHVVSVNTVAIWPDLDAGLDELRRVLAPGGSLVLAWHRAGARSRASRRMGLPAEALDRLHGELGTRFDDVLRTDLTDVVEFRAR